jgi:uncharacterized OB-fold protein
MEAGANMGMRGHGLGSTPNENPIFDARIELPYTLTTGRAAGSFLAALGDHKIIGSRCPTCKQILVPAQDFCAGCGESLDELVELPAGGELTGFTETANGILGLIRLDGASTDIVHRLLDVELDSLAVGQRFVARWADERDESILDIAGFELDSGAAPQDAEPKAFADPEEPVLEKAYGLRLDYDHAYGPYYGTLFDGLATSRRIQGTRCPNCACVLVPPREYCDACFERTEEWVDVADTGVIKAFSIIHLEFVGQVREPPYVYAEIVLDGAATRLIHTIGGIEVEEAMDRLSIGMPVRAVWKDSEPIGSLEDILYFEPIFEDR